MDNTHGKRGILVASLVMLVARTAAAHTAPTLHVDDSYESCFFDLHPELTQAQFNEFAGEAGTIARFHQLADARTLGRWRFDVSLQYTDSPIDQAKGAWNNTMSHPEADHYLGDSVSFPRLVLRAGVADSVDVGVWGSLNPLSNYGFLGAETKIALRRDGADFPVAIALRPNATAMIGPAEVWAANLSLDLSVSRTFGGFTPYAGVATSADVAVETSDDVNLDPGHSTGMLAFAGLGWNWKAVSVGAEGEIGKVATLGLRLGARF